MVVLEAGNFVLSGTSFLLASQDRATIRLALGFEEYGVFEYAFAIEFVTAVLYFDLLDAAARIPDSREVDGQRFARTRKTH